MAAVNLSLDQIDEAGRRRFEGGWAAGDPPPLEACLPPEDSGLYESTLAELVCIDIEFRWKSYLQGLLAETAADRDESVGEPPGLETYLEQFPRLDRPESLLRLVRHEFAVRRRFGGRPTADEYRRRFPQLAESGRLTDAALRREEALYETHTLQATDTGALAEASPQELPEGRFGGYELLAGLGAGGMGVVYKARQPGTRRIVALKVIRQDRLADQGEVIRSSAIERFRTEAMVAARLEHQNIVSVYEAGETDGQPFYSMQYVDGRTLSEMVGEGPLPARRAAELIEPVARAVHAAHQAGVLHRDLKPQNIFVDSATGRPLVGDFGLAKLVAGREGVTRAGEVLGTPSHMAPEQARSSAGVSERTDVYGLGATLYHLLTGRPPFQAATPVETLRQVLDEEPAPPSQLNAAVDRDLETICLKCLQKDPQRRYESAAALADDLQRYLAGKPILARPAGRLERSWRWCRRNPLAATLAGAAVAGVLFGFAMLAVGLVKTQAALDEAQAARVETHQAVNDFFTEVSENVLLNKPGMQPLRRSLLNRALIYYRRFVERSRDDPELRSELGRTWYRIGEIVRLIESPSASLAAYDNARAVQQSLLEEDADEPERLYDLSNTLNAIGAVLTQLERFGEAMAQLDEARALRERLVEMAPAEGEYHRKLANTLMNLGLARSARIRSEKFDQAGDVSDEQMAPQVRRGFADARRYMNEAQKIRQAALEKHAAEGDLVRRLRRDLAKGLYNLGNLEFDDTVTAKPAKRLETARGHVRRAAAILDDLVKSNPENYSDRRLLAICYRFLAQTTPVREMDMAAAREETTRWLRKAAAEIERIAVENPRETAIQIEWAGYYRLVGEAELDAMNLTAAEDAFEQEIGILTEALKHAPGDRLLNRELANVLLLYAHVQRMHGRLLEAITNAEQAVQLLNSLAAENASDDLQRQLDHAVATLQDLERMSARAKGAGPADR